MEEGVADLNKLDTGINLKNGLVAYWSFDNCDATDDSGNGHDGKIFGNPECVEGISGKALLFNEEDGDNGCGQPGGDYIVLPTFEAFS